MFGDRSRSPVLSAWRRCPDAVEHLERLAAELNASGMATDLREGSEDLPALLRVWLLLDEEDQPVLGENVMVGPGLDSVGDQVVWWFWSSREPLAPCDDTPGAVAEVSRLLMPTLLARAPWPGAMAWRGNHTGSWWAFLPSGDSGRFIEAVSPRELLRAITAGPR
jgi:hypothetical protein